MENQVPVNQSISNSVIQTKPSNFLVILLSVSLLLSVSIAGFFAFQTQKLVKEIQVIRNKVEPVATVGSEVESTSNLKIYVGNGFSFQYPQNWNNSGGVIQPIGSDGSMRLIVGTVIKDRSC